MENVLLLAKFWGLLLVSFSLIYLLRPEAAASLLAISSDQKTSVIFGLMAILLGAGSLALYSSWAADWRLCITLLGWSAMLKGVLRLGFSRSITQMTVGFSRTVLWWWLLPILLFGVWLLYSGYSACAI